MDAPIEGILSEFATITKLGGNVDSLKVKRDLNKLETWAITNHMKFNKDKFWILGLGHGNPGCECRLGNKRLETSAGERDLGILVDAKLNLSHCVLAARRATHVLRGINHSQGRKGIVSLCSALEQPYLE